MGDRLELVESRAWARRRDPAVRSWFDRAGTAGAITICDLVVLELLRSVAAREYERIEQIRSLNPRNSGRVAIKGREGYACCDDKR